MGRLTSDQINQLGRRLHSQGDLIDLMEYFTQLSEDNYESFKNSESKMNDIHKGYALCVDNIMQVFGACNDDKQKKESFSID